MSNREKTRDLLEPYEPASAYHYDGNGCLHLLYPWARQERAMLEQQVVDLARDHGFQGTETEFWDALLHSLVRGTLETFPVPGSLTSLYLDTNLNVLYYYKETDEADYWTNYSNITGIRMERDDAEEKVYLYIPVSTYVLTSVTIDGNE